MGTETGSGYMGTLKMLSLFSGIGGIDLAAEWAGIETVAFCEIDPFCQKVLKKHWPDVPIFSDIKQLRGEDVGAVDIVAGGFPCQPYSLAGKRKGKEDERDLWPEMLRIIQELRPGWVLGENVPGLLSDDGGKRLSEIIQEMGEKNYETRVIVSPAGNYGTAFEGKRVFIIAKAEGSGHTWGTGEKLREFERKLVEEEQRRDEAWGKVERCVVQTIRYQKTLPGDLRINYGIPDWVDRIRALGNTVVPQQAYPVFKAIAEIEAVS